MTKIAVLVFGLTGATEEMLSWQVIGPLAIGSGMLGGAALHGIRSNGTPPVDPRRFTLPPFGVAALARPALGAPVPLGRLPRSIHHHEKDPADA